MGKEIKHRLLELGKKQVDLLCELRHRGHDRVSPQELSCFISGVVRTPKSAAVLKTVLEILNDWENLKS